MASPGSVVIQFLAKTTDSIRDITKLDRSLDKLDGTADGIDGTLTGTQRAFDKTGGSARDNARDLDKAETGFDQLGDEAEQTADRLRRSASEMAAGVRTGAQDVEREAGGIKQSLGEAGRESGAEFIGNIAEGIGSGQANLNDVITGTLGGVTNLAASLTGPVGIAAGVAAAGVGLVFSAVKGQAEKTKERVDTLTTDLEELGETASKEAKKIIWDDWLTATKETAGAVGNIVSGLKAAGINSGTFQKAIEGDAAAQKKVLDALKATGDRIADNVRKTGEVTPEQQKQLENMQDVREAINKQNGELDTTKDNLDDINFLTGKMPDGIDDATDSARDLNDELDHAARNRTINFQVNVKGGQTMGELLGSIPRTAAAAAPATRATEQPVNITVYNQGPAIPNTPRALIDLLETHTVRMGRKPGAPRAVSW